MNHPATAETRNEAFQQHLAKLNASQPNEAGLYLVTIRFDTEAVTREDVVKEVRQIEGEFNVFVGVVRFPDENKDDESGTLCALVSDLESLTYFLHVFYNVDIPKAPPTRKRELDDHPDAENIRSARRHNHDL